MAVTLLDAMKFTPTLPPFDNTPDVPIRAYPSGKAWHCETGRHKWHRRASKARWCAYWGMPMESVSWLGISHTYGGGT